MHGQLLERDRELATLAEELVLIGQDGRGRLVLIAGEAGIGKSTTVDAFCEQVGPDVRVLRGACDALQTPRAAGPLLDVAEQTGGRLADLTAAGAAPSILLPALVELLREDAPTVLVLEDLHWADSSTLDVLRLLARRLPEVPALVISTYRDDLPRTHPLRVMLGELPRGAIRRLTLPPLSPTAVAELGELAPERARAIHAATGGNPFFVTELIATGTESVPPSVRDAVLARTSRMSPEAQRLLEAVAVIPQQAELGLLRDLAGADFARVEECVAVGLLQQREGALAFRHEIARNAVLHTLPADRALSLHAAALHTLESGLPPADPARLTHHAKAGGDVTAILRHAPAAGEQAAALGAHREAAAHFATALEVANGLPDTDRCRLLDRRSYECYLTEQLEQAIAARRASLAAYQAAGNTRLQGDAHRWLSRLSWFAGDNATAESEAVLAVEILQGLPPGHEFAMALSNMAQLRMLAADLEGTRHWGEQAITLAESLGDDDVLAHALNNVGTAELWAGESAGQAKLERSLSIALEADRQEHVARAYTNLGCQFVHTQAYAEADSYLEAGVAYCNQHDLRSWEIYMLGWQARSQLEQGHWRLASATAGAVLDMPSAPGPTRFSALIVLGLLRARRGDPDAWSPLDEAAELAGTIGETQRVVPVALARAEAHWIGGDLDRIVDDTEPAFELACRVGTSHEIGALAVWRRFAGGEVSIDNEDPDSPWHLELCGDHRAAATRWDRLGCPYEAALARLRSGDPELVVVAHEQLVTLGARAAAAHSAAALRAHGVRGIKRGPRQSTRKHPAELTARELEVLALMSAGQRNAEIADQLVLSERTVAHHVAAIMRKLGARSRTEAVAKASAKEIAPAQR